VDLEDAYLADVGFGDGIFDPIPIREAGFTQRGFAFRLEELAEGWWRIHNHPHGGAASFDFRTEPCDRSVLERQCVRLQTSPESSFRKVLVVERHVDGGLAVLRGRVLRHLDGRRADERVIEDRRDFEWSLRDVFDLVDLEPADLDALWVNVVEQHRAYVAEQARLGALKAGGRLAPSASAP
jgi:N-hydroxyarylamine O-acetyltransferase